MVALFNEFKSTKNKEKRKSYHATFEQKEKDRVKRKWKEKMHKLQKHIFFFDFIENYYVPKNISKNSLNMVKKSNFVKEDKTIAEIIDVTPLFLLKQKKIIEPNFFVNNS